MTLLTLSLANCCLRFLLHPEILLAEQDLESVRLLAHVVRGKRGRIAPILDFLRYEPTVITWSTSLQARKVAIICVDAIQFRRRFPVAIIACLQIQTRTAQA